MHCDFTSVNYRGTGLLNRKVAQLAMMSLAVAANPSVISLSSPDCSALPTLLIGVQGVFFPLMALSLLLLNSANGPQVWHPQNCRVASGACPVDPPL